MFRLARQALRATLPATLRATLLATLLTCVLVTRARAQSALAVGDTLNRADFSWAMMALTGERVTLEAFRGRVIIVNSWATWCEPCVAELRTLAALRAAIPDSALAFVLVSPQQLPAVRSFVTRRALRLPVYLELSPAPAVFGFAAVPTTWIIDRTGRIALRRRGAMRWDTPAMQQLVRRLLER